MTPPASRRARLCAGLTVAAACALLTLPGAAASAAAPPAGIPVAGPGSQPAIDPVTGQAFIATGNPADNVAVIDIATSTVTATIPTGTGPFALAADPGSGMVYTANRFSDSVSVISTATNAVSATIAGLPGTPVAIAADPVTDTIDVELSERDTPVEIAVIDGTTSALADVITLPAGTGNEAGADGIAVDPVTGTVYASFCSQSCDADIINAASGTVTGHLAGPLSAPPTLAVDPASDTVYVGGGHGVTAYNGATGARIGSADLGNVIGPETINPSAGTLYVPEPDSGAIALLDAVSLATTGYLPIKTPYNLAVDPAADTLAVQTGGSLSLIALHPPAITSTSHATITAGRHAIITITATGTPPPVFTTTGHLPSGLHQAKGSIIGTPGRRAGGTYALTITASNGIQPDATQHVVLTVDQAPAITSRARAWFKSGARHTFTITASAYPAAAITELGALPPGLRFVTRSRTTATITGTPRRSARGNTYRIRITASNRLGRATQTLTIHVTG